MKSAGYAVCTNIALTQTKYWSVLTMMLTLLRELQHLWEIEGEHDVAVANAARLLAECLTDVTCDADLTPGAPPAVPWKDTLGMVARWL